MPFSSVARRAGAPRASVEHGLSGYPGRDRGSRGRGAARTRGRAERLHARHGRGTRACLPRAGRRSRDPRDHPDRQRARLLRRCRPGLARRPARALRPAARRGALHHGLCAGARGAALPHHRGDERRGRGHRHHRHAGHGPAGGGRRRETGAEFRRARDHARTRFDPLSAPAAGARAGTRAAAVHPAPERCAGGGHGAGESRGAGGRGDGRGAGLGPRRGRLAA